RRNGASTASPESSTVQRGEEARTCQVPPPAPATVRANGGASRTSPAGDHTTTAVGAPTRSRPPANATPEYAESHACPHHQCRANAAPQFFSAYTEAPSSDTDR